MSDESPGIEQPEDANETPSSQKEGACKVGYAKPPTAHRFKKGVSGNPSGRPRKKFSAASSLKKVFSSRVMVTVQGRKKSMNCLEAVFLNLRNQMLQGDVKAIRLFMNLCDEFGANIGPTEGQGRLDELIAALEAGPVEPGVVHENIEDEEEGL